MDAIAPFLDGAAAQGCVAMPLTVSARAAGRACQKASTAPGDRRHLAPSIVIKESQCVTQSV